MAAVIPEEIWLFILTFLPPCDLWRRARHVSKQFQRLSEELARFTVLPRIILQTTYTLGSGATHRWYDVWATVGLSYVHINETTPQYALFALNLVKPESFDDRALEKWKRMCAAGLAPEVLWRIALQSSASDSGTIVRANLPRAMSAEKHGVWFHWKELLDIYCARLDRS